VWAVVRVRFAAPRAVAAISPRGETLEVPVVHAVTGQVVAARGDTLVLQVEEMEPRAAPVDGWRTTVVRTAGDQVSVWRENWGGTLVLIGAVAGALTVVMSMLSSLSS
jgi:hypothetical protein